MPECPDPDGGDRGADARRAHGPRPRAEAGLVPGAAAELPVVRGRAVRYGRVRRVRRATGAKVLRIGDRTAEEAYEAVKRIVSYDTESWAREITPGLPGERRRAARAGGGAVGRDGAVRAAGARRRGVHDGRRGAGARAEAQPRPLRPTGKRVRAAVPAKPEPELLVHLHRIVADAVFRLQQVRGDAGAAVRPLQRSVLGGLRHAAR